MVEFNEVVPPVEGRGCQEEVNDELGNAPLDVVLEHTDDSTGLGVAFIWIYHIAREDCFRSIKLFCEIFVVIA